MGMWMKLRNFGHGQGRNLGRTEESGELRELIILYISQPVEKLGFGLEPGWVDGRWIVHEVIGK